MTLREQWEQALEGVQIIHFDPTCKPTLEIYGYRGSAILKVSVANARDTTSMEKRIDSLTVSCVTLEYWPGIDAARKWLAAAWSGYVQHEAMELVLVNGVRPLDPHAGPEFDKGLRHGFPSKLTRETMERTLLLAMSAEEAAKIVGGVDAH